MSKQRIAALAALVCAASAADAALIDRGNGLIYDSVLNITWLQDARLAASNTFGVSGIFADGSMDWYTGIDWIDAMNAAQYRGFSTWRMPDIDPVNGIDFQYAVSYDGSTDKGFNNTSPANELSHLYYALGNISLCSTNNATGSTADNCNENPHGTWGLQHTGPFTNFVTGRYWTGQHDTRVGYESAFDLDANFGQMGTGNTAGAKFVWAVIDGDVGVSAVPVPGALWLLGSGLIGLVAVSRRRS